MLRHIDLVTGAKAVNDKGLLSKLKLDPASLELHQRSQIVDLYVFRYPYPGAMNKPEGFIAITTTLQQMIGDDDSALIGIVNHELTHEYVAADMTDAHNNKDFVRLGGLGLFCDAVATASFIALGLDPPLHRTA